MMRDHGGGGGTSSEMSQVTVDSAEMFEDQGATSSNLEYPTIECMTAEWTNEKHCLYLKTMEASFVNELHFSMGLLKGHAQKYSEGKAQSGQFMTLRDGTWKNVSANRCGNMSEEATESRALLTNPWVKHYRHTGKHQVMEAAIPRVVVVRRNQGNRARKNGCHMLDCDAKQLAATRSILCRQDSVGSNSEMSGQNFATGEEVHKPTNTRPAKRPKTDKTRAADNDQVVPSRDFTSAADLNLSRNDHQQEEVLPTRRSDAFRWFPLATDPNATICIPKNDRK